MSAICVFCSSSELIGRGHLELAADLGTAIAARGHSLVSGGGSVSMMGAVARAVRAGGGHTLGVIPRVLLDREVADHDADELLVVDTMRERKALMDAHADAFIALPGGIGTLEELFEVWTARTLGLHDKPVVVCDPDDAYEPLRAQIIQFLDRGFVRAAVNESVVWTTTATEALDAVESGIRAHAAPLPTTG
ncbi:MAG: hypothetical protein QOG49_967, partial [Frankiaceae bacterium]|nr:hypothetical protein [Frankiaceae bacterium]